MTDFTAVNTEVQKLIDQALAADSVVDAAALQAALAADAAADAVVLKAKDDEIARLTVALAACEAGHPPADTTAPSVPTGLTATVISSSQINLAWSASTDAVGVTGYLVLRNGAQIAAGALRTYSDTGLTPSTAYSYAVKARDAAGNVSATSVMATATTGAAAPPATGWPDASNTGVPAGTALTNSGSITTTAAGQVIEGKNISGTLNINHNGVIVRKCKIGSASFSVVRVKDGLSTPPVIEDCEVDAKAAEGSNAINGYGTFRRLNIHNCENCFNVTGNGCLIEDCYLWGLKANGSDPHYDNIQIDGGTANHVIRHNTIINDYGQTAAVMIDNWFGPISNVLVDNNVLKGGGYTVYSDGQFNGGPIVGVKFTNNRFKKGYWGYATWEKNTPVWTGNVDDATGKPIPISEA